MRWWELELLCLWLVGLHITESLSHLNGKGLWEVSGPPCSEWSILAWGPGCWAQWYIRIILSGCSQFFLSLPTMSFLLYRKAWKAKSGKCVSLCHAAPMTGLPNILGEVLGEVSHHEVQLGCCSSSTVPLNTFGMSCCAEHSAASSWLLPNLAALPRVGPDPPKCFRLWVPTRVCAGALCFLCF